MLDGRSSVVAKYSICDKTCILEPGERHEPGRVEELHAYDDKLSQKSARTWPWLRYPPESPDQQAPRAVRQPCRWMSMRHQQGNRRVLQHVPADAPQDRLSQSRMSVEAHDDEIAADLV